MNPAVGVGVGLGMAQPGGTVGSQIGRGPKDRLAGVSVMIVKGPNKGHAGTIRDTNGGMARVELQTSAKVITIEKEKLRRRKCVTYFRKHPWHSTDLIFQSER